MMRLLDFDPCSECYAVRLLAGFLDVPLDLRRIDVYPGHAHEEEAFLRRHPLGTVPVLEDGAQVVRDWQGIMAHLAFRFDASGRWWPAGDARLIDWLGFARRLGESAGRARLHDGFGVPADIASCRIRAHRLLRMLDRHLWQAERDGDAWIVSADHPTVADIAVFVHAVVCEEGGVERIDYPAIRRWIDRLRYRARFVPLGGVFPPPPTPRVGA